MIKTIVTDKKELSIPCVDIHDQDMINKIVQDLIDTAAYWTTQPVGCLGLAANQIGYRRNIFIIWHCAGWKVFVNPNLGVTKGKKDIMKEGCLSRPNVHTRMQRYKKIRLIYLDYPTHELKEKRYTGFIARVIQHEYDHLLGKYI